jgi:translation initiation factor IF-1
MVKEMLPEFPGTITKLLPNARAWVTLENEHAVAAHRAGEMRGKRIRVLAGDKIFLEMTPCDLTKARIIHRFE